METPLPISKGVSISHPSPAKLRNYIALRPQLFIAIDLYNSICHDLHAEFVAFLKLTGM
jgi:hypothetical protein